MATKIETTYFSSGIALVSNPEIIKIMTIRKKHLEQIIQIEEAEIDQLMHGTLVVLGTYSYKVIVQDKISGRLGYYHNMHVLEALRQLAIEMENVDVYDWSHSELNKFPQIFAD